MNFRCVPLGFDPLMYCNMNTVVAIFITLPNWSTVLMIVHCMLVLCGLFTTCYPLVPLNNMNCIPPTHSFPSNYHFTPWSFSVVCLFCFHELDSLRFHI